MEKMPYQPQLDARLMPPLLDTAPAPAQQATDWRNRLPELIGSLVTLRELRASDAQALFAALTSEQVSRFISPPPATVEGFERFIAWAIRQRQAGQYACFAVVPHGTDLAVGIFQVRSLEPAFGTAEWGFALASEFWGRGLFVDSANLIVDFVFAELGTDRLEARAAVKNGRGNGALRKIGAVQEAVLRRSFCKNGEHLDQALWTILKSEWIHAKSVWGVRIIH